MSSKKTIEFEKPKKPLRGRPKNKFVRHPKHWCIPFLTFCDEARSSSKCREESPMHTMPFPFEDFDCGKYIVVPKQAFKFDRKIVDQVLGLASNKALEAMIGLVDCQIKLSSINFQKKADKYLVTFEVIISGKEKNIKTKTIPVLVDIEKNSATLVL